MEVVGEDQALQAILGRGDFDGIDNEALDFSQLQDYINEDNDSSLYFHEALVGSEGAKTTNPFHCETAPPVSNSTETTYTPYNNPSSAIYKLTCERPTISKSVELGRHPSLTVTSSSLVVQAQPHHLPDSPPDSGSEPPFSPPHEDPKLTQGRTGQLEKMQSQAETLKHFMTYGNTQPLKHLPDTNLNVTSPHQHSPHQNQSGNHPLLSHNSSVPVITQLSPAIPSSMPVVSSVPPPTLPSLVPTATHLGTMFPSTDDYICENLDSPTNNPSKKRKLSDSSKNAIGHLLNGMVHVKQEPAVLSPEPASQSSIIPTTDEDYSFEFGSEAASMFMDSTYQCIKFHQFQPNTWHVLLDRNLKELPPPNYRVDADKGFNFSNADDAFVCQKKNHFQVTTHVQPIGEPQFVKTPDGVKQIENFYLHFHGAKVESPSQMIKVEQSQSDRSKKPFYPVLVELAPEQVTKTTVGRLHFSETTSNNMRKKGKPNPDQRYFYLVVALCAHVEDQTYQVISHASERIIVRASNPGQFENDMELCWQKGHSADTIYHAGRVGINTDRPEEALVVHGNVKISGHIVQPSDSRVKRSVEELDTKAQLQNVANIRIVKYRYLPEFGKQVGLKEEDLSGTGVLAQDVQEILPDAVREIGKVTLADGEEVEKFLVVNKERIFMENVGAVKELCKVTDKLETRIDELERMNKKLTRLKRIDSIKSTSSGSTVASRCSTITNTKKMLQRHRCHSQMNQSLLCTNHLVQAAIIILLLVMAFCLAAIATLYILEWHKWHEFQSSSRMLLSVPQETQRSTLLENNRTTPSTLSSSLSSRLSTPMWTTLDTGTPSNTHSLAAQDLPVSSTRSSSSGSNTLQSIKYATPLPTWDSTQFKTRPKEIGIPSICVEHGACSVICCASVDIPHQDDIRNGVRDSTHMHHVRQNSSISYHNPDYIMDDGDSKENKELNETEDENKDIDDYPSTLLEHDGNFGMEIVGDNSAMIESQTPLPRSKRSQKVRQIVHTMRRRDVEGKEDTLKDISQLVESIHLVELNTTLDDTYCESSMRENVAARYVCHIPLSKYMNLDNVTLEFRLRQSLVIVTCQSNDMYIDCPSQQSAHQYNSVASAIEGHDLSWRLPIGVYLRSKYVFRILSHNIDTHTPCLLPAEEAGLRFLEYWLRFYRVCDK